MSLFPINSYATDTVSTSPPPAAYAAVLRSAAPEQSLSPAIVPVAAVKESPAASVDDIKLDTAVAAINRFLKPVTSSIEFSVDKDSGRTIVQVIDTDTQDVLRQFPSKDALAISHQLDKLQGLLIRDKA